jgi:Holliday junction resolvase
MFRVLGWSVLQISVKDGPDLFAAKHKRTVAAECKSGKSKLRPGQVTFRDNWRGEYAVLRCAEDVVNLDRFPRENA